jgi:hypothetical protein
MLAQKIRALWNCKIQDAMVACLYSQSKLHEFKNRGELLSSANLLVYKYAVQHHIKRL